MPPRKAKTIVRPSTHPSVGKGNSPILPAKDDKLKKKEELNPTFELIEGVPTDRFGMSEVAYNSLMSNLAALKPDKNHLQFALKYKLMVGKIIKKNHPEYAIKYSTNREKAIASVWRTA